MTSIKLSVDKGQVFLIGGNFLKLCLAIDLTDMCLWDKLMLWITIKLFHLGIQPREEPAPAYVTTRIQLGEAVVLSITDSATEVG